MGFSDDHTNAITNDLAAITDPAERARAAGDMLKAIPALQAALREARQTAVLELRDRGDSHAEVAKHLGVSRGRAQAIAEGKTTAGRKNPD